MPITRRHFAALPLAACLLPAARASGYPDKPVRLVMPFPAGGMGDILARHLATDLSRLWGQPVVVDNRAGASGMIGNEHVARSAPDGSTLLLGISQLALAPWLYPRMAYDVEKDFVPLARVADAVSVFVTNDARIASVKDYVALARANPDRLSYGTYGAGTSAHIFAEIFNRANGIRTVHVPKNVFTAYPGSRKYLCGMGCKAQRAANSPAIGKRCNAADRPHRHLPEGLGRNRAISSRDRLHGHEPMRRAHAANSSRLRPNATPDRP
ncbi:MAG: tripartite tricarboxylate transporter substrate-binding protein [Pseudorhodoferax sp.]